MAFPRRLQKELQDLQEAALPYFTPLLQDEGNALVWQGLILPQNEPYNKGAFRVEFNFPPEYPFKPPQVSFKTKIYHPNIAEDGQVCLPLVNAENWKPTTRLDQVVEALVALVNCPEPERPLRPDLAKELLGNKKKFFKLAQQFTSEHAESRPSLRSSVTK